LQIKKAPCIDESQILVVSGTEALTTIASAPKIDVVLADFAMPEMTGVELERAIRARSDIPVILLTGYRNPDALSDTDGARVLQKPYTEGELVDAIEGLLH
jgi:CheY-like chemotaxis protein